jgi:hypothetical protein
MEHRQSTAHEEHFNPSLYPRTYSLSRYNQWPGLMTQKTELYVRRVFFQMTSNGTNTSSKARFNFRAIGTLIFVVILGACVLGSSSCTGEDTVWTAEALAPDGRWLATARTVETGGLGTGSIATHVELKWMRSSSHPETILLFVHDKPPESRTIDISMKWITPSHLDVTYNGRASVQLQMVKYGDVDISLRELPSTQQNSWQ